MNRPADLSEDMYRRIYRLIKRQIDPRIIAATLNIPYKTVTGIISRFEKTSDENFSFSDIRKEDANAEMAEKGFLDLYFFPKTRYAIIQVVGTLIDFHLENFTKELEKAAATSFKAIAIKLSDVTQIDQKAAEKILDFNSKFQTHSRYLALLDPSPALDELLIKFGLEGVIPVFGTERAFEDTAFSHKKTTLIKRIQ